MYYTRELPPFLCFFMVSCQRKLPDRAVVLTKWGCFLRRPKFGATGITCVSSQWNMLVPIYLELADGRIVLIGRLPMTGNSTLEDKVPLKGIKDKPHRARGWS